VQISPPHIERESTRRSKKFGNPPTHTYIKEGIRRECKVSANVKQRATSGLKTHARRYIQKSHDRWQANSRRGLRPERLDQRQLLRKRCSRRASESPEKFSKSCCK
jgi:hypothetical protein